MSSLFRILAVLGLLGLGLVLFRIGATRTVASCPPAIEDDLRAPLPSGERRTLAAQTSAPTVRAPRSARLVSAKVQSAPAPQLEAPDPNRLVVQCVDERGEAIPEARVVCVPPGGRYGLTLAIEGTRDPSGAIAFEGLWPGEPYELAAKAPGFRPACGQGWVGDRIRTELKRAVTLAGIVRQEGDGRPLAGARVRLHRQDLPQAPELQRWLFGEETTVEYETNEEGRFSFDAFAHGDGYLVTVAHPAGIPELVEGTLSVGVELEVSLAPANEWWFRVVDLTTGTPIEGARLHMERFALSMVVARTDAEGLAPFPVRVPPVEGYGRACYVTAPGYAPLAFYPDHPGRGSGPTPLLMIRCGSIEGVVRTPAGEPLVGALVMLQGQGLSAPSGGSPEYQFLDGGDRRLRVFTNTDGSYRLEGVAPGMTMPRLRASHPDHADSAWLSIPLPTTGERVRHDLVMGASGLIEGTVTCGGIPSRADVAWMGPEGHGVLQTDGRGRFRKRGAAAGEWRFLPLSRERTRARDAHLPVLRSSEPTLLEGGETARVALELYPRGARRLRGVVRFENGEPAPGVYVRACSLGLTPIQTFVTETDVDGAFSIFVPADGASAYRVNYGSSGSSGVDPEVPVPCAPRSYRLATPGRIGVRLLDSRTSEELPLSTLEWRHADGDWDTWRKVVNLKAGRDDRYWATFPSGWIDLRGTSARGGYFPRERLDVEVRGDADEPIDLVLERGIRLILRFQSAEGEWEPPLLAPCLLSEDGEQSSKAFEPSGFERTYPFLRPGRHRLGYMTPGFGTRNPLIDRPFAFEPAEIALGDDLGPVIDVRWRITDAEAFAKLQEELRREAEMILELRGGGRACPDY